MRTTYNIVPQLRHLSDAELHDAIFEGRVVEKSGCLVPRIAGGAEIFPNEGLDILLAQNGFQTGGTAPANLYLCLFTAFSASSVGTSAGVADSFTEPGAGGYVRETLSSASWGSIASTTSGRMVTGSQVSFPVATAPYGSAVNGYWFANQLSSTGDKCICAANFDDTTAVTINTNDQIKVTPTVIFGG